MQQPTHLDLFSGIGGFALAFESVGFRTIGFAEDDPYASAVIKKHWAEVRNFGDVFQFCRRAYDCEAEDDSGEMWCPRCDAEFGDCNFIGTDQFTDENGFPDVITGGDPCQENSNACRTASAIKQSPCNEFVRIIRELQPRFVLRENPSVVSGSAPWPWQRFAIHLEALGYRAIPIRTRACCHGAPTRRERMFLLAAFQDSDIAGLERHVGEIVAGANDWRPNPNTGRSTWWDSAPSVRTVADGLSDNLAGRRECLQAIGNSVYPQVVQIFARAIHQIINEKRHH